MTRGAAISARKIRAFGYGFGMQPRVQSSAKLLPDALPKSDVERGRTRVESGGFKAQAGVGWLMQSVPRQYVFAGGVVAAVSGLNLWLEHPIGYQATALVYLLAVVVLALLLNRGPIIFATTLTAFGWGWIAPPRFSIRIASFYDQMMMATYFVVALTISELTRRLRAHREAEMKTKVLAESERLGRTLLNSVSHELRTPLATITGAAGGLRESGPLTPAQQHLAEEIESAGARLNRVVQSLLNAARIQSGQVRPKPDWCDVPDLVRVALRENAYLTANHPVETQIAAGLPLVKLDLVLALQALGNLLANAATHTPAGTPVEIRARVEDKNLALEVADRGPGLPPDQLEHIFELFHRAPAAKPGGTGLGLAIVKGFIEVQGGSVQAANRAGGGAVFTIRLPAADSPQLAEELL